MAEQADDLQPPGVVAELGQGSESRLAGVLELLVGQGAGVARAALVPQQCDQLAGRAGGEAVVVAGGGLVIGAAKQGFGLPWIHPSQGGGEHAEVLGVAGGLGDAPQRGDHGPRGHRGVAIPVPGLFQESAGDVPVVAAEQVGGGGQPGPNHDLAGVPPGLLLLDPPPGNLSPPCGEFGVHRGGHRLRGRGMNDFGDAGVDLVDHPGIRVGRVGGIGGDQRGERLGQEWRLSGLVQPPPQIGPVPVEGRRVPVGLLDPAQGLQQQPRRRGQGRGGVDDPRGEGLEELGGVQRGVALSEERRQRRASSSHGRNARNCAASGT